VTISRQKIRKNIKTYETKEKDKILCFQSISAQLLDIKQLRKKGARIPASLPV